MKTKDLLILFIYLSTTLLIYFPTYKAGFVTDFLGWLEKFENGSYADVITTFGWHANQQVAVLFFYTVFKIFSIGGLGWFIVFSTLHAVNAWLAYKWFNRFFSKSVRKSGIAAFAGSALFLLSPFQAEVLVWRVCMHYLLATLFILCILNLALSYLETEKSRYLLWIHGLFLLALFTLEISVITPFLITVITVFWADANQKKPFSSYLLKLIVPQFALIGVFLAMNKIVLNDWIGHYGASVHLNFQLHDIASKYLKYTLKYLLFSRFWSYDFQMKIFSFIEKPEVSYILLGGLSILLILLILLKRVPGALKAASLSLIMFFISLTPVITLYMVTLLYGENDRYGYLASIFFWMAIAIFISSLPRTFFYLISAGLVGVSLVFTLKMTSFWSQSSKIYESLLNDFRWFDRNEVVILNIPDNYRGLYMFRIYNEPSGLQEALSLIRKKPFEGKMREITQYNMMRPGDAVSVKTDSTNNYTVSFSQWGNWWWWEGIGNSDFENEKVKVKFDGINYHLQLKDSFPGRVIIYQVGDKWVEVK